MLLPNKSDIDRSKILERRADIEQGKAITGRLDELRKIWLEESATIEKSRKAQIEALKADVAGYVKMREAAKKDYEQALEEVQEPKQQLEQERKEVAQRKKELDFRHEYNQKWHNELDVRKSELHKMEFAALEDRNQAAGVLASAQQQLDAAKERAERLDASTTGRIEAADKDRAEAMDLLRDARLKNEASDSRKKVLDAQADAQKREQQRLSALERSIIDREQALQRELGRQVKKIIH